MYPFLIPNYKEKNIVNLMSSISNTFWKKHDYNQLNCLTKNDLDSFDNIVLIVVDGLGYNYLQTKKDSFLLSNLHERLTSTFLSTTASANTVFQVGYPPQQHWLTGRTMNIKELGWISMVLPFKSISWKNSLSDTNFEINKVMDISSFHRGFKWKSYTVIEEEKSNRDFIKYVAKETKIIGVKTYIDMFLETKKIIEKKSNERKFIHVYLDDFDSIQHSDGINTKTTNALFTDIDKQIKKLSKSIEETSTKILVVSDHGFVKLTKESELWVDDFSWLEDCLTISMTWEPRVKDCFIRPNKVDTFLEIVSTQMSEYCWCFPWEQLINDNFYGLWTPNKKLLNRVWDYVLIMKDNFVLRNRLANDNGKSNLEKGSHGAMTGDEVFIPLIVINC